MSFPRERLESGLFVIPGPEFVTVDGIRLEIQPAYLRTDGVFEPGLMRSEIRTRLRYERWDGLRVKPIVCLACYDTGVSPDINTDGTDVCWSCYERAEASAPALVAHG